MGLLLAATLPLHGCTLAYQLFVRNVGPEAVTLQLYLQRPVTFTGRYLPMARQVLTETEFAEQMVDQSVMKYVAWDDDGRPVGMCTMTRRLETVPWIRVVNLARALEEIAEATYWRIGLTGEGTMTLAESLGPPKVALVLGAEGEGMRANTEAHCDQLARLPISPKVESLNVSNAAAIALYAVATA